MRLSSCGASSLPAQAAANDSVRRPLSHRLVCRTDRRRDEPVLDPSDRRATWGTGEVVPAKPEEIRSERLARRACAPRRLWDRTPAGRSWGGNSSNEPPISTKRRIMAELMALVIARGRSGQIPGSRSAEVREGASRLPAATMRCAGGPISRDPSVCPGPAGERNEIQLHGRGGRLCLHFTSGSFPLGDLHRPRNRGGALAAGNAVMAQARRCRTPLVAAASSAAASGGRGNPGAMFFTFCRGTARIRRLRVGAVAGRRPALSPGSPSPVSTETAAPVSTSISPGRPGPIGPFIARNRRAERDDRRFLGCSPTQRRRRLS